MKRTTTRRQVLKGGLAVTGLGLMGVPEWVLPALAQGETLVAFADMPENLPAGRADTRLVDVRKIDGPFTPKDQFYTVQHYGHPTVDAATFKLKVSGMVDRPRSFSLDDLRKVKTSEFIAGFECSGNRRPLQGLCSNGRWTGVPLKNVLDAVGVKDQAREFVFFGADKGEEEVEFRTDKFKVEQQFGRSLTREKALSGDPFLAWALNGEPLTRHQGSPLRLVVPGWYGVANVKWLSEIHVQDDQYRGEMVDGEMKWKEAAVTHMQLKSFVARVTRDPGGQHKVLVVALNDGSPIKSVDVKVDEGPWQPATLDQATNAKYGWKLYHYTWSGATKGEHTIVSRAVAANGAIQPTAEELATKKTFLEDNSQHPRKVTIA
jgi:DMSO/TMAO reductase YedYZ molybdopterin-dependent catalytic subunit